MNRIAIDTFGMPFYSSSLPQGHISGRIYLIWEVTLYRAGANGLVSPVHRYPGSRASCLHPRASVHRSPFLNLRTSLSKKLWDELPDERTRR